MSAPSTSKRPRSSSPELTEVRDSRFYFKDGSVVLSARDEHDMVVYFRVHASLLSRESTVFEDMFNIPTPPPSENDTYDGVPLVIMHDKAEHLRGFLQAIYDPHTVFLRRFSDDTPKAFTGPLILAKKYEANTLTNRMVQHIEADWPSEEYQLWKTRMRDIREGDWGWPCAEKLVNLSWTAKMRDELKNPLAMAYYTLSGDRAYLGDLLTSEDFLIMVLGRRKMEKFYKDSVLHGAGGPSLRLCESCEIGMFKDRVLLDMVKSKTLDFLTACEKRMSGLSSDKLKGLCGSQYCERMAQYWLDGLTMQVYLKIPRFFPVSEHVGWDDYGSDTDESS